MKHTQIKSFLKVCEDANVTPYLWGNQGIGKSQLIHEYADEHNIEFIDLRLSLMEPGDLLGMPIIEDDRTVFKKPQWFPKEGTKGVLFLDELNRANEDILQAVFQLILDRKIAQHELPDSWQIVCAGNYGDQFDVLDLDPALMNRFCHIKVDVLYNEWTDWAEENNIHPEVTRIVNQEKILYDDSDEMEFSISQLGLETTPRGWELLSRIVDNTNEKNFICESAQGILAQEDAAMFIKMFNNPDHIKFTKEHVYEQNEEVIERVFEADNVMELCGNVNSEILNDIEKGDANAEQCTNFLHYLVNGPEDSMNAALKQATRNNEISKNLAAMSHDNEALNNILNTVAEKVKNANQTSNN